MGYAPGNLVFDLEGPPTTESPTPILLHPPEPTQKRAGEEKEPEFRGIPRDLEPDTGPGQTPGNGAGPGQSPKTR